MARKLWKRTAALLLALALLPACALADWADDIADELAARVIALSQDEVYLRVFTAAEDVRAEAARMGINAGREVEQHRRLWLREDVNVLMNTLMQAQADTSLLSEAALIELEKRLGSVLPSILNGYQGAAWLAAATVLTSSATYAMPEGFRPVLVHLLYGTDVDVMVAFAQTGEDTITATATFVDAAGVVAAMDTLNALYEQE